MDKLFNFDFQVAGLTYEQAEALLNSIIVQVADFGGTVGGGFAEAEDEKVAE